MQKTVTKGRRASTRVIQKRPAATSRSKKSFHIPFEEFQVPELDDLLGQLELVKPEHWTVVVSDAEDAQHIDCMRPLTFINVHPPEEDSSTQTMGVIYQYCAGCKTAVRVL